VYEDFLPKRWRHFYLRSRHRERIDEHTAELVERGYSARKLAQHLGEWLRFAQTYETEDIALPSSIDCRVRDYLSNRPRAASVSLRLLLGIEKASTERSCSDSEVSSLYARWVPPYLEFVRHHRGRRTTHQLENCFSRFFAWLKLRGIADFPELTVQDVRDFASSLQHFKRATVAVHASALRGLFDYLRVQGALGMDLVHAIELPPLYEASQPPRVLEAETVERILTAVDRSTDMGKRDFAILLLAARYGLRSSDIRSLCFDNICWREQRILLVQSKTQQPLELPLLADVDEALVDYIRHGRPRCCSREIFVRHTAPIGPFARRNSLWPVMSRALRAARIELTGRGRGLCLLRHSVATRMLRGGVPFDTISDVLGHCSVETTRRYAQVDMTGLSSVAMTEAEVRQ
jgi:site-specific recombinase XerD